MGVLQPGSALWIALEDIAESMIASLVFIGALLAIALLIESRLPHARPVSRAHTRFNLRYTAAMLLLLAATRPLQISVPLILTRTLGVGWVAFGAGPLGWATGFFAVLLFTDLLEYLFHRAQHRFSFMWKMHELHHSAEHYDVTLAYRQYWLEPLFKTMFMYPLVGILFKAPAGVGTAVGFVYLVNHHVAHLNLRYSPRRIKFLFSHPQYHRMHHSRHERDYNRNFCDLLPLWDMLFGTLRRVDADEFVDVGLISGLAPRTLMQALLWPWYRTRQAAMLAASSSAAK